MKAIIFGASGQDGYFLKTLLVKKEIDVISVSRKGDALNGDVGNLNLVATLVKKYMPDYVFHFAACSTTRHDALFENHETISTGTLNILESVRLSCPKAKVFISGSAMQFKNVGLPINENTPFDPGSPYAVSRIQSVYAARYYRETFGVNVYVGYLFNHDSEFRGKRHINKKIALAANRIAQGKCETLVIGDIEVQKEFNYAVDIVDAIWTLVNQHDIFEVVIGSGKTHSIREWIACCFKIRELSWESFVEIKSNYTPEYNILVSDPKVIMSLGWKPRTDIDQLAKIMLEDGNG